MSEDQKWLARAAGIISNSPTLDGGELHKKLAASHPKLSRGQVWCLSCGHTKKVDSAGALANGWPKCCGYTMTIDSPEERSA